MIHDRLLNSQFVLDLKPERSTLLQTTTNHHMHQLTANPIPLHTTKLHSPSPPMGPLDLYTVYSYQHQKQFQQQLQLQTTASPLHQTVTTTGTEDVLDLSRARSDYSEPPSTPSPPQGSNDSLINSPCTTTTQRTTPVPVNSSLISSTNLLYSTTPFTKTTTLPLPIYSNLYHPTTYGTNDLKHVPEVTEANTGNLPIFTTSTTLPKAGFEAGGQPLSSTSNGNCGTVLDPQKNTRPFKAYPRDPLVIAASFAATDVLLDNPRVERYTEYRKRVLEQIRHKNGGSHTICNPKMRRTNTRCISISEVDTSSITSETEERPATEESSDCDSNADRMNNSNFSETFNSNPLSTTLTTDNNIKNYNTTAIKENKSPCRADDSPHSNSNNNNNNSTSPAVNSYNNRIIKDAAYYERRRKNNAAAKKSRDRRRIKEDEIAMRAAYLERQNIELLCQINALKDQLAAYTNKIVV